MKELPAVPVRQVYVKFFDQPLNSFSDPSLLSKYSIIPGITFKLNGIRLPFSNVLPYLKITEPEPQYPLIVEVTGKLLGGKGGFGSMLRAQGGRMSKRKASSYDSCRNLDGVRISSKKQAAALSKFISEEPQKVLERDNEIEKAIDRALNPTPKKYFAAGIPEYLKTQEKISDALEQAFLELAPSPSSSSDENEDNGLTSSRVLCK